VAGLGEAGGGVLIVLGLATPAAGAAALTIMGPGDWSLDAQLDHRLNRPWMAAAMIASSAVALTVVQRRRQVLADRAAATSETSSHTQHSPPADPDTQAP
jgi:putative oxidoreductase